MKNRKALALGGLLMAVAVTAYSVSGTYAKYISKVGGTDTARVARWSFNDGKTIDLFDESYLTGAIKSLNCSWDNDKLEEVCDNVVAPGASGEYEFQFSAGDIASEVNYKLSLNISQTNTAATTVSAEDAAKMTDTALVDQLMNTYNPIQFKLTKTDKAGTTTNLKGGFDADKEWMTSAELINLINDQFDEVIAGTGIPSTDGTTVNGAEILTNSSLGNTYKIEWKWDFEAPTGSSTELKTLIDKYDTKIGNASANAASLDAAPKVSITIEMVAEQVTDPVAP